MIRPKTLWSSAPAVSSRKIYTSLLFRRWFWWMRVTKCCEVSWSPLVWRAFGWYPKIRIMRFYFFQPLSTIASAIYTRRSCGQMHPVLHGKIFLIWSTSRQYTYFRSTWSTTLWSVKTCSVCVRLSTSSGSTEQKIDLWTHAGNNCSI